MEFRFSKIVDLEEKHVKSSHVQRTILNEVIWVDLIIWQFLQYTISFMTCDDRSPGKPLKIGCPWPVESRNLVIFCIRKQHLALTRTPLLHVFFVTRCAVVEFYGDTWSWSYASAKRTIPHRKWVVLLLLRKLLTYKLLTRYSLTWQKLLVNAVHIVGRVRK